MNDITDCGMGGLVLGISFLILAIIDSRSDIWIYVISFVFLFGGSFLFWFDSWLFKCELPKGSQSHDSVKRES